LVGIFSKHDMSKENVFAPLEVIEFLTSKVGKEFNTFVFEMERISYKM
jgi:transcription antitermination factor NusA-like protein